MKRNYKSLLLMVLWMSGYPAMAQDVKDKKPAKWSHSLENNFYIYKDDFTYLPIYTANKDWLHLEARYNYEEVNTFSGWLGYNFAGGNKFQYLITPMLGAVVGEINGIAPALEYNFGLHRFELYSESEFVFDFKDKENNFFYNWTDLTYSPLEWLWAGLSIQRTRLYETNTNFQGGFLLGGGYKWFELTGYAYNVTSDYPYFIVTLGINIPYE